MAADDDKKLILARRAKFVAAALAGVAVACGKEPTPPAQPCLSVPMQDRDAGRPDAEPPPMPCLTPMRADHDAGPPATTERATDAGGPTTRSEHGDAGVPPKPTPCLAPPLPTNTGTTKPPPRPCLSVVKPPDKESR